MKMNKNVGNLNISSCGAFSSDFLVNPKPFIIQNFIFNFNGENFYIAKKEYINGQRKYFIQVNKREVEIKSKFCLDLILEVLMS